MEEKQRKRIKGKAVLKHETESDWALSSYVPDDGEMVLYDEDATHNYKRAKYGNGTDKVKDLPFALSASDLNLENGEGKQSIKLRSDDSGRNTNNGRASAVFGRYLNNNAGYSLIAGYQAEVEADPEAPSGGQKLFLFGENILSKNPKNYFALNLISNAIFEGQSNMVALRGNTKEELDKILSDGYHLKDNASLSDVFKKGQLQSCIVKGNYNFGNMFKSVVLGDSNNVVAQYSLVEGNYNSITGWKITNIGNYHTSHGESLTINGGKLCTNLGWNNQINNSAYCFAMGSSLSIDNGTVSTIFGGSCINQNSWCAFVAGRGLRAINNDSSATFGQFNIDTHALLTVGNGADGDHRSNAFEVLRDGRAKVYGLAKEENDVITQKYLGTGNKIGSKAYRVFDVTSFWEPNEVAYNISFIDETGSLKQFMTSTYQINISVRIGGKEYSNWATIYNYSVQGPYTLPEIGTYYNIQFWVPLSEWISLDNAGMEGDYLKIVGHPELGTFDLNEGAIATGKNNIAAERMADAGGYNNIADGKYSFVRGSTNVAGYCAASFGAGNNILGQFSLGTGQHNTAELNGTHGLIFGQRNWLKHARAIVGGYQNITDRGDEAVFGVISAPVDDALLKVGNGKENNDGTFSRSNAFVVHDDGRITAGKDAVNDMDVPNYKQVKGMIPVVPTLQLPGGHFTYHLSNINLFDFIVSEVILGQTSIEITGDYKVTKLPTGTGTLRCLVNKTAAGLIWVQGFRYDGAVFSTVYDTVSWSPWRRLDISEELAAIQEKIATLEQQIGNVTVR